ncbi:MAG: integrase catalytic domain-containing protein [Chloroflexota bacterium]
MRVKRDSKHELAAQLQRRYLKAGKAERGRMLREFVETTGYHPKYASQLLRHGPPKRKKRRRGRPPRYGLAITAALKTVAEALNWICGKRLHGALADVVPALEAEGVLRLKAEDRAALLQLSPATIDRRLGLYRRQARPHGLGTTKPGTLLKQQVPIQTYLPWDDQKPGFVEIDLVAHCGLSTAGFYLNTLTVVDVASGWTDVAAVWGKGQQAVFAALQAVRARLPFPLLGIDIDNGSEFLNAHMVRFCQQEQLTLTRCRPYWKNDQAHVEQKNYSVVRRLIGYDRYESREALDQVERVDAIVRPYINGWQPVFKLIAKQRDGAKVTKRYDRPQTPLRRLLASNVLTAEQQAQAQARWMAADPMTLRRQLDTALDLLWKLRARQVEPAAVEA